MSVARLSVCPPVQPSPLLAFPCSPPKPRFRFISRLRTTHPPISPICPLISGSGKTLSCSALKTHGTLAIALLGAGCALTVVGSAQAATELPILGYEPSNALSLPTWAVHVSSVVEWVTAMALVWRYGDRPGFKAWKGLSWGMVPLLGGALCACTWHFFYNSESLDVLVAIQAALTFIGNATMCIASYRIYKSREGSETS